MLAFAADVFAWLDPVPHRILAAPHHPSYIHQQSKGDLMSQRGLAMGGAIGAVVGIVVSLMGTMAGTLNAMGWSVVAIYVLLLVAYASVLRARPA